MSIYGVGIDLLKISRMKKLIHLYGVKIMSYILSKNEKKNYYIIKFNIENILTKNFSVKESFSKALGIGIKKKFMQNCELFHDKKGKPKLKVIGYLQEKINKNKIKKIHVSITDTNKYVQSIVILEK